MSRIERVTDMAKGRKAGIQAAMMMTSASMLDVKSHYQHAYTLIVNLFHLHRPSHKINRAI